MYNLLNELLSDISALLLHRCVQLRQPYKLVEMTQIFLQCNCIPNANCRVQVAGHFILPVTDH